MAIVHDGNESHHGVPAVVGSRYWWFQNDRKLLTLEILKVLPDGSVELAWTHYVGLVDTDHPVYDGTVTWNQQEWEKAVLSPWKSIVLTTDLADDEEICRICHGGYFETLTDLEIVRCAWCDNGRQKKRPESAAPTSQRSPLHPVV